MTTHVPKGWGYRLGSSAGRAWRAYGRREQRVVAWLVERDVPVGVATVSLWIVKLVLLGVLLYVAFWLAALVVFVVVAARVAEHGIEKEEDDFLSYKFAEPQDHRESVFYHPFNHDDDPDPRFDDQ